MTLFHLSSWLPGLSLLLSTLSTTLNALHYSDPLRTQLLESILSSNIPKSSIIQSCPMDAVLHVVTGTDLL
jgi:hypothetical protein